MLPCKRQSSLLTQIQLRAHGLSFSRVDTQAQLPGCGPYAICFSLLVELDWLHAGV
jgi:hypothetical protein